MHIVSMYIDMYIYCVCMYVRWRALWICIVCIYMHMSAHIHMEEAVMHHSRGKGRRGHIYAERTHIY